MAFALFYEPEDLAVLELYVCTKRTLLTPADRQLALKCWNGGLKDWGTALLGQSPFEEPGASPKARMIVIDDPGVTLQEFRDLLYRTAVAIPGAGYLKSLSDDMGGSSGAVEPWPVT